MPTIPIVSPSPHAPVAGPSRRSYFDPRPASPFAATPEADRPAPSSPLDFSDDCFERASSHYQTAPTTPLGDDQAIDFNQLADRLVDNSLEFDALLREIHELPGEVDVARVYYDLALACERHAQRNGVAQIFAWSLIDEGLKQFPHDPTLQQSLARLMDGQASRAGRTQWRAQLDAELPPQTVRRADAYLEAANVHDRRTYTASAFAVVQMSAVVGVCVAATMSAMYGGFWAMGLLANNAHIGSLLFSVALPLSFLTLVPICAVAYGAYHRWAAGGGTA